MNKKILIGAILLLVLIGYSYAIAPSSIIGYVAQLKNGEWTLSAVCAAGAEACKAMKFTMDPSGAVKSETLGGFKEVLGRDGAKAVDAAISPQTVITQELTNDLLENNPELKEFYSTVKQLEQQGEAKEVNAEMDVKTGDVKRLDKTEITKPVDISNIVGIEEGQGKLTLERGSITKSENRDYTDIELKADTALTIKNEDGSTKSVLTAMEGNVEVDDKGVKKLKGEVKERTSLDVTLEGKDYRLTIEQEQKVEFDREKGIFKYEGKEAFDLQPIDKEGKPMGNPIKITPATRADGVYEKTEIKVDPITGYTRVKGKIEIESEDNKIAVGGWGFRERGEAAIMTTREGRPTGLKAMDRYTEFKKTGCFGGDDECLMGGGEGTRHWFPGGLTPEEKNKLREETGTVEIFPPGEFGEESVTAGDEIRIVSTIEEEEKEKRILLTQTGDLGTQMRYEEEITKIDISSQERPRGGAIGKATVLTPHTSVKIDTEYKGLFTNPTFRSEVALREAEGEKLGQEVKRAEITRECFPGSKGEPYCFDLPVEKAKVVDELTVTYPHTPDYDISYHLETDTAGITSCARCPSEFADPTTGYDPLGGTGLVVGIDSITGAAAAKSCIGDLVYYRNYEKLYDTPWALNEQEVIDYINKKEEGKEEYLYESGKYLKENNINIKDVGRVTLSEFIPAKYEGEKSKFKFSNEAGEQFEIEYKEGEAGAVIYKKDPETGKDKVVGYDNEITSVLAGVENEVVDGIIKRHTPTGAARDLYARLQALEEQRLAREGGRAIVKKVSH